MYRKSTIAALSGPSGADEPKGLKAFSPYLPEDNLIAHGIMHQLKLSHAMTPDLAMD
jgi:ceramide glucosyltransferase